MTQGDIGNHVRALLVAAALAVTGCDEGDSGTSLAPITTANAPLVAGEVLDTILAMADLGVADISPGAGGGSAAAHGLAGPGQSVAGQAATTPLPGPAPVPCLAGGTVTTASPSLNPAPLYAAALSPGDRIAVYFNDCDEGDGTVTSGGLRYVVTDFVGDLAAAAWFARFELALAGYRVAVAGQSTGVDGAIVLTMDRRQSPGTAELSGQQLALVRGLVITRRLTDFAVTMLSGGSAGGLATSVAATGTLAGGSLRGHVDFVTVLPLGRGAGGDPSSGQVEIHGAGGARILVSIKEDAGLTLQVDANGDGAAEAAIETSLTALRVP
jgi:hypothetical protein